MRFRAKRNTRRRISWTPRCTAPADMTSGWMFQGLQALGLTLSGIAYLAAPITVLWAGVGVWLARRHRAHHAGTRHRDRAAADRKEKNRMNQRRSADQGDSRHRSIDDDAEVFAAQQTPATGTAIKRAIPSSGEQLPVIGLGTYQAFDVGSDAAVREQLQAGAARARRERRQRDRQLADVRARRERASAISPPS